MDVLIVVRNNPENGHRSVLGAAANEQAAAKIIAEDIDQYGGVFDESDYQVIQSSVRE